ncbi:hypothetical protein DM01DRAFT_1403747 [Hesseltinella vesiculosa]|uniref:Uncharacterized protein n=1 Tax=Hesseltinella vesiculosa TaxID=101127 RepID=A0A1X2GVH0_9FUNG|nr:hypothetical protein DM01DRAFT_1403747 [Hesseltinella vesiculosa]
MATDSLQVTLRRAGTWVLLAVGTLGVLAVTYLCLAFARDTLIANDTWAIGSQTDETMTMTPKLILHWSWTHSIMLAAYLVLFLGILPAPWVALGLGLFIGMAVLQLIQNTQMIADRSHFLWTQLSKAWLDTQNHSPQLIEVMEDTWQCKGIVQDDPSSCYAMLKTQFGDRLMQWAVVVWCIKFSLIIAGFVCAGMYVRDDYLDKNTAFNGIAI